ncbi:MAG: type IV toxin-antitoxin system AbiEi family antitoxin [Deltaproteobacteria bacterium]|nr:type IV toxin-antitoxin system AbiEi family antitoxin [Deltaproteobacteria bacterium]
MDRDKRNTEEDILQRAIIALKKTAPLGVEIETITQEPAKAAGFQPDRVVRIVLPGKELKYCAEIKANLNLTKAQALLLRVHRVKLPCPLLLVVRHVNAEMAEELRQNGLEFIDTTGNVYINQPPVYIFVKGNRPLVTDRPMPLKRTFRTAGLRVIYGFLCNPGLENKTYREIAATAGVALGTVDWIMKELKELGFLLDMGKAGLKLIQKETLLQRWMTAYPEQLRPKQLLGRYRGQQGWWEEKKLAPQKAQWGGEVAAARLTKYLQPELITIYTAPQELNKFLLENRLRKDLVGDVEILERFWQPPETLQDEDLVHPILVYADLLATGNQRNMETAKMIYEQYIVRFIRED